MKEVCNNIPQAKLLLVGDGPIEKDLRQLAKDLGISNQCIFVGRQEHPHAFFRMADVAVSASEQEGMSNSTIEAQMMGKPVIACSAAGSNRAIIYHEKTGFLFGSGNTAEYTSYISRIYQSASLRAKMGLSARGRFLTYFSVDDQARRYAQFYRSVAGIPNREKATDQ